MHFSRQNHSPFTRRFSFRDSLPASCALAALLAVAPLALADAPAPSAKAEAPQAEAAKAEAAKPAATTEKTVTEKTVTDNDAVPPGATEKEIELGRKAAAELEKDPKIKFLDGSKDPAAKALLEKLNTMVAELGKASARPNIKYTVKIIDDDDLNAFTLPNGNIYVYRGLLDAAGSDDEIAAVLSHEIGHNARMHALRGQAKARKLSWVSLAALAAMLAGGRSGGDIAVFSQYLLTGIMNGYSVDYEKEADDAAIVQLAKTHYNPSALVSFMNRLTVEEKRRPEWEPGIFRTHPPSEERAAAAIAEIKAMGLPFTPRDVTGAQQVKAIEAKDRVQVMYGKTLLMELAATADNMADVKSRADKIATQINDLMRNNLKMHEITTDGTRLLARGIEVTRVQPADAQLQNLSVAACAQKWRDSFRRIFWKESINGAL